MALTLELKFVATCPPAGLPKLSICRGFTYLTIQLRDFSQRIFTGLTYEIEKRDRQGIESTV